MHWIKCQSLSAVFCHRLWTDACYGVSACHTRLLLSWTDQRDAWWSVLIKSLSWIHLSYSRSHKCLILGWFNWEDTIEVLLRCHSEETQIDFLWLFGTGWDYVLSSLRRTADVLWCHRSELLSDHHWEFLILCLWSPGLTERNRKLSILILILELAWWAANCHAESDLCRQDVEMRGGCSVIRLVHCLLGWVCCW